MGATFSQFWPPSPRLTEENLPRQDGKVFVVTGGASGVGFFLAKILYQAGGKVYIAGRSEPKASQAIESIKSASPSRPSPGTLSFLYVDLSDLSTISSAASTFLRHETKLNVLFNNAGVSLPPLGSLSAQNHDLQIATNCLGPYLLTQLLLPALRAAAVDSPPASVRVVWTSSQMVDLAAPSGGFTMTDITSPPKDQSATYTASKVGNWFLASEFARRVSDDGILSVTQNPGNLKTDLLRHAPWAMRIAARPLLWDAKMGAYTELWAGLAEEVGMESGGGYVVPWGRVHPAPREDLLSALRGVREGGTGRAAEFWEWCEEKTKEYR